jgi:hypothetical protein
MSPPFGDEDTKYTSIDMETIARAPILSDGADIYEEDPENLEAYGLFVPTFPTEAKKVWAILLACLGLSSMWQHVKKFASQQNGHQACVPSTAISWGGIRSIPWSLTSS